MIFKINQKKKSSAMSNFIVIIRYLFGMGIVNFINIIIGISLVWILPIREYALYVLISAFLTIGTMLTNNGISQGVTILGAQKSEENLDLSVLFKSAIRLSRKFYLITVLLILFVVA